MKRLFILVLLGCLTSNLTTYAGDVRFGLILSPGLTEYVGEETPVEFELKNPLGFDVTGLTLNVKIRYGTDLVYDQTDEIEKVEKQSDLTYRMSLPFSIERSGAYQLEASFTTDGSDIDETNNSTAYQFSAEYRVGLNDALATFGTSFSEIARQYKGTSMPEYDLIWHSSMPLPPGTTVRMADRTDIYTMTSHGYLFTFDLAPFQKMGHPAGFVAVSATDPNAKPTVEVGASWTVVNGTEASLAPGITWVPYHEPSLVTQEDDDPIVSTPIGSDPPTTTCAILIAGRKHPSRTFDDHRLVFRPDVDSVYKEITTEAGGMRVDPKNVVVLYDPSEQSIDSAAQALKDKGCSRLFVYYSGHGFKAADQDKYTCLFLRDGAYPGTPIYAAMDLVATVGAQDYVFVFDCCYAGDAIRQRTEALELEGKNVIILASSHADSVSKSDIQVVDKPGGGQDTVGRSEYTKALLESWGKPGISTPLQAHHDVVRGNPTLGESSGGGKMNDVMQPQSYGEETQPAENGKKISFDELDLEFADASGFDPGATLTVSTWGPAGSFASVDGSISSATSYRAWNIMLNGQSMPFTTSISFDYLPELDGVEGGSPGIIRREGTSPWTALPTEVDADNRVLIVRGISSFSDWAVANTTLEPVSVNEDRAAAGLDLRVWQSGLGDELMVVLSSNVGESVTFSIVGATTGATHTFGTDRTVVGSAHYALPTTELASGAYVLVATTPTRQTFSKPFMIVQ